MRTMTLKFDARDALTTALDALHQEIVADLTEDGITTSEAEGYASVQCEVFRRQALRQIDHNFTLGVVIHAESPATVDFPAPRRVQGKTSDTSKTLVEVFAAEGKEGV